MNARDIAARAAWAARLVAAEQAAMAPAKAAEPEPVKKVPLNPPTAVVKGK